MIIIKINRMIKKEREWLRKRDNNQDRENDQEREREWIRKREND